MGNEYKYKYNEMRNELKDFKYFTRGIIKINVNSSPVKFFVYRFNINETIINNANELALKKVEYTMDEDQSGAIREKHKKLINQTKGILAEMGCQLLLETTLEYKSVKRWDLERSSFEYEKSEYDVKFSCNTKEYTCESRSSTSYKTSLIEFVERYHVIGPYISKSKDREDYTDFYFRPVFQYIKEENSGTLSDEKIANTMNDLASTKLQLFFVSGATLDDMKSDDAEVSSNNQDGTEYRQIRIIKVGDMDTFFKKIGTKVNKNV